jgi:malonyl-CoA/methylmalonyl-CoA synthetase
VGVQVPPSTPRTRANALVVCFFGRSRPAGQAVRWGRVLSFAAMSLTSPLFPRLTQPDDGLAVRVGDRSLSYRQLAAAASVVAAQLTKGQRVALVAEPTLETAVGLAGALAAGASVIPLSAKAGLRELEHVLTDAEPTVILTAAGVMLPEALAGIARIDVLADRPSAATTTALRLPDMLDDEDIAVILYTSGTTGLPKGVLIPRRAVTSNLDAIADAWGWTGADRLTHALPLYHVHGLLLGTLGPWRRGGAVELIERFSPEAVGEAIERGATMLFAVPTMYRRLAQAAEASRDLAVSLGKPRILVSGSAALPAVEHERFARLTGQRIVERYGMTETLMNIAVRVDGERRAGFVGLPVPGVDIRLVADDGQVMHDSDNETIGEIQVKGPNLFVGYLNRPDATEATFDGPWFKTGDIGTRAADGYYRIVGRRATDMIKTGGYRIGAGEIEGALLEHPAVSEVAVAGRPDEDLGERIVAWVVLNDGATATTQELVDHVARLLSGHKRPRVVHFVSELPRNHMGKVVKSQLV